MPLQWVLVDGEPRIVTDFATLPPRRRPRARCPECGDPLVLKLGRVRIPHAAHRPDAVCAATHPETELHINLKHHIAAQLSAAVADPCDVRIGIRCADAFCPEVGIHQWLPAGGWDRVAVEARLTNADSRRTPDILLYRDSRAVAAVEVFATHAVDDEKERALFALGLPWIEVKADAALCAFDGGGGWTIPDPLPVFRAHPIIDWRCEPHAAAHAERIEGRRHDSAIVAARVVDLYRGDGTRTRHLYAVREHRFDRSPAALSLMRDGREIARAALQPDDTTRSAARRVLREALALDMQRHREQGASIEDSPMRWATGESAIRLIEESLWDTTPTDPWPLATRYPRRFFYTQSRGTWFLAPEMRDVTWDREPHEAFGAHPSWIERRAVVRERAIATGYSAIPPLAGKLRPEHLAELPARSMASPAPGVYDVELETDDGAGGETLRPHLVALTVPLPHEEIRRLDGNVASISSRRVWLAHPRDWSSQLADIPWAPAGTTGRAWPRIVVDGAGVFRLGEFGKLFAAGERRVSPDEIRRRLAARVSGLA